MDLEKQLSQIKMRLSTALSARRIELKMTQTQFQSESGLAQCDISQIENGKFDKYSVEVLLKANLRAKTGLKLFDALK